MTWRSDFMVAKDHQTCVHLAAQSNYSIELIYGKLQKITTFCINNDIQSVNADGVCKILGFKPFKTYFYRWENLYFNPRPTSEEIVLVCSIIGLTEEALIKLLPSANESVIIEPIRLCAACYRDNPWHLMQWQYKSCQGCEHHQVKLLSACPACSQPFQIPAHWSERMTCLRCHFTFSRMCKKQRVWR